MKKIFSNLTGIVVLLVSLFSINPALATDTEVKKLDLEYWVLSQAEKCKQNGNDCKKKKVCIGKDLGVAVAILGGVVGIATGVNELTK